MDDDALIPQIVFTVQETQRAFQNFLYNYRAAHGPDSRELLALDAAMQALGTIVGILDGIESRGGRLDLLQWMLRVPIVPSIEGHNISIAQALIWDMRNLEQRLNDVTRMLTTDGTIKSLPSEAIGIRQMVKKYHSIISKISNAQMMYVFPSSTDKSILIL
jgi:hypothetical protein